MARIAFTSDLHVDVDPRNKRLLRFLIEHVNELEADAFIIAGDITPDPKTFYMIVEQLEHVVGEVIIVAGNHDIWVTQEEQENEICSRIKYEKILPNICRPHACHYLWHSPFKLEKIGFAGTIGWYDYSFAHPSYDDIITTEDYQSKCYQNAIWFDVRYAHWMSIGNKSRMDDNEVTKYLNSQLEKQLSELEADRSIEKIVVVTHHLPFSKMVVYKNELPWDFFSAFMGNRSMGELILSFPKVELVLSGHSHFIRRIDVDGINAYLSAVGYAFNWPTNNLEEMSHRSVTLLEL